MVLVLSSVGFAQDETRPTDSLFQAEFKNIFGSNRQTNLTAAEYLTKLVAGESDDQQFVRQINLLGSESYVERQSAEAFLFSVPVLPEKYRTHVEVSPDMEVRYRLKSIFQNRKSKVESLLLAALKSVAKENEVAALANVFQILEMETSAEAQKVAAASIRTLARKSDRPLLLRHLQSKSRDARVLSAELVIQLGLDNSIELLLPLLNDDDETVQLEVARRLIDQNEKKAIRSLIDLLQCERISVASRAERILRAATEQDFGFISYSDKEKNELISKSWKDWESKSLAQTKLRIPLEDFLKMGSRLHGNTLIAKDADSVIELDADRVEIFRLKVDGVLSAEKTADGNYLLFSYTGKWLKEYSPEKKLNWSITGIKFNNAMPLDNGNVLVCVGPNSVVQEIDPKTKKTVWEHKTNWWPNDAYRLENGNTLIGGKGGVVEVTPEKKVVWEYKNSDSSTIVVAKPTQNDAVLIGWTSGTAKEIDKNQKVIWEYKAKSLSDVFRDNNGNTLFATSTEIIELDGDKKIVWRYPKKSKTATIRR